MCSVFPGNAAVAEVVGGGSAVVQAGQSILVNRFHLPEEVTCIAKERDHRAEANGPGNFDGSVDGEPHGDTEAGARALRRKLKVRGTDGELSDPHADVQEINPFRVDYFGPTIDADAINYPIDICHPGGPKRSLGLARDYRDRAQQAPNIALRGVHEVFVRPGHEASWLDWYLRKNWGGSE